MSGTPNGPGVPPGPAGPPGAAPERHTAAVVADRFDRITWRDTCEQSAALRALAAELGARHAGAADLMADVFLAAYQTRPRLRDRREMAPARLVNHRIVGSLVAAPHFADLHRETAGDPYAAAMAVLAQAAALRGMLERSRAAQEQADRAAAAERAAEAAGPTADAPADRVARQAAEAAGRALAAAAPGLDAAARNAAGRAARAARHEAALMRAWGLGPGDLERMPFDRRARLAERLGTGRFARWAELIGRFRQMAAGEHARAVESTAGELVGVTLGDDLSRVIPSELAHLGLPATRAVFAARYAAGELMLYDTRAERPAGRGAVIACVDTSHSMYAAGPGGVTREAWAKACALALLDQARRAGRDFVGILFSSADRTRIFRFPAGAPAGIDQVLDFAETFLGGGTSYQTPLTAARDLLADEFDAAARTRGDIVMITDDECDVTQEWLRDWREAERRLAFRVFGVSIGAPGAVAAGSVLDVLCDNVRSIEDLTDVHAAADLFRVI
ncbi:VWA domain-containing protein [Streptomyces marincola]|uniref:VWFA domain-containing protein n=1 Tax=Streptomyces marincola TaxID=2878388 RepID=A0A1W7CS51_9ACTN|nr:VWA domain-containing protein [Streptomyces marincola]ARQ67585.1 hypothetical protein CAG99_00945 [Streptomyces marincola]